MKDYIDVIDNEENIIKMEVVSIFQLKKADYNYIIYKELDDSHYYIGKYKGDNIVDIDTNLNAYELELANIVLKGVKENGTIYK